MNTLVKLKEYANKNFIPIAREDAIEFLINLVKENNYKRILEIGTAIGYTSINLALIDTSIKITTLELDNQHYQMALTNFATFQIIDQIQAFLVDAAYYYCDTTYDLIFIDAAKKKNIFFFEKFSAYLKENGTIIIDNLNLADYQQLNKKKERTFSKIKNEMIEYFTKLKDYEVKFFETIADGLVMIKKIKKA